MKSIIRRESLAVLLALAACVLPSRAPAALNATDEDILALVRSTYASDRQSFIIENLQLTDKENLAFWPMYLEYRLTREKLGDELVKVVLEYADAYPNMPEDRSLALLKQVTALDEKLTKHRNTYLKKFAKVLPASKTLRFAQLENRMDLGLRLQLAASVPIVPTEGEIQPQTTTATGFVAGFPGRTVVQTREVVASVTAVDRTARTVTLLSPEGIKETFKVRPEVANFDQVEVGDRLKLVATEELVVKMADPGESAGGAALVALAPKGVKPGGIMAGTTQVSATVTSVDANNHTATLRFEDGSTKTLRVRSDVELSKSRVGQKVMFAITEMLALKVEKP